MFLGGLIPGQGAGWQFAFQLDPELTADCCACSRKYYKWEYKTPPNWITSRIPGEQLKEEIEYINKLSDEKTVVNQIYFFIGPIVLICGIVCYIAYFSSIFNYSTTRSFGSSYIFMIIGIFCVMFGIMLTILLPSSIGYKAAEVGRKSVDEYVQSLNSKYKNEAISFEMQSGIFSMATRYTSQGWWRRADWAIVMKPDGWQPQGQPPPIQQTMPMNPYMARFQNNPRFQQQMQQAMQQNPNMVVQMNAATTNNNNVNEGNGNNTQGGNKFCTKCGNNVAGMAFCGKCGTKVN